MMWDIWWQFLRVQLLLINPLPVKSFARYTLHTLPIKSPGKAHEERVDARLPGPEWFVSWLHIVYN